MRIYFTVMERIAKMTAKFNMATQNHVTAQNLWLRTTNLKLGSKSQNGHHDFCLIDTISYSLLL